MYLGSAITEKQRALFCWSRSRVAGSHYWGSNVKLTTKPMYAHNWVYPNPTVWKAPIIALRPHMVAILCESLLAAAEKLLETTLISITINWKIQCFQNSTEQCKNNCKWLCSPACKVWGGNCMAALDQLLIAAMDEWISQLCNKAPIYL